MSFAVRSAWRTVCEERIEQLSNYPWYRHDDPQWQRAHAREVRRWRRRLFWAKWGRYASALVGALVGALLGFLLLPILQILAGVAS